MKKLKSILLFWAGVAGTILCLAGCAKTDNTATETSPESAEHSAADYKKVSENFLRGEAEVLQPDLFTFRMTKDGVYFVVPQVVSEETQNDQYKIRYSVYRNGSEENAKKLCTTEDGDLLSFDYKEAAKEFSLLMRRDTGDFLMVFGENGQKTKEIKFAEADICAAGVVKHCGLTDGNYLIMGHQQIVICNEEGEKVQTILCPGKSFQSAIQISTGEIYVSYLGMQNDECFAAKLNVVSSKTEGEKRIAGDGIFLAEGEADTVFAMESGAVYEISLPDLQSREYLDLSGFAGFDYQRIREFAGTAECFQMISWSGSSSEPIQLITFLPKTAKETDEPIQGKDQGVYDASGRRRILVYDPLGLASALIGDRIIDDFNYENEKYYVEVDSSTPDVNTMLAGDISPDLMLVFDYTEVEKYYLAGYLENLLPYIEQSELISPEDIQKYVYTCFGYADGLYAIPRYCQMSSLFLKESACSNESGWGVEEFLAWLQVRPELVAEQPVTREHYLDVCLRGNLEEYIDLESGEANCLSEAFLSMLSGIQKLNFTADTETESSVEKYRHDDLLVDAWFGNVTGYVVASELSGEKLIHKGLPNASGKPVTTLQILNTMCMLRNGTCKEGAYEFLEYVLRYPLRSLKPIEGVDGTMILPQSSGTFYSLKSVAKTELEYLPGEHEEHLVAGTDERGEPIYLDLSYEVTEDTVAYLSGILDEAGSDNMWLKQIRSIIQEEAQYFFQNQKTVEETAQIIQNRVQLYLDERE